MKSKSLKTLTKTIEIDIKFSEIQESIIKVSNNFQQILSIIALKQNEEGEEFKLANSSFIERRNFASNSLSQGSKKSKQTVFYAKVIINS